MPRTRLLTALLAWAIAVVGATAIGLTAVGAIGAGIVGTPQRPLSAGEVESLLTATPTPAPALAPPAATTPGAPPPQATEAPPALTPSPTPSALTTTRPPARPAPAPRPEPGPAQVIASPGGTVVARCDAGVPVVVSTAPAQGFRVKDEGGEDGGRVRFEADESEVEVRLSCRDGRPVAEIRADGEDGEDD